ncbi:MAG: phosphoribosylformylglycinamidine synthase subunit PurS [Maricaulaceae bacterium]
MKARVQVGLKPGVLDPEGQAIAHALTDLGFAEVTEARKSKVIELALTETDPARAKDRVEAMCERLLANPVIESYRIEIED